MKKKTISKKINGKNTAWKKLPFLPPRYF
jgi:hypothetical protein